MNRDDILRKFLDLHPDTPLNWDVQYAIHLRAIKRMLEVAATAEREKLKHELLTLEKWKGMALAKDGDGRTVQEIEREAREAEREACAVVVEQAGMDGYGTLAAALLVRERGAP